MDPIGKSGLLLYKGISSTPKFTQRVMVGTLSCGIWVGIKNKISITVEDGFGDAKEIESIGRRLDVFSLSFGLPCIDVDDTMAFLMQREEEVTGIGWGVFAANDKMLMADVVPFASSLDSFEKVLKPTFMVTNGKGFQQLITISVAQKADVFFFGKVQGANQNFLRCNRIK